MQTLISAVHDGLKLSHSLPQSTSWHPPREVIKICSALSIFRAFSSALKGEWDFELKRGDRLEDRLHNTEKIEAIVRVVQEVGPSELICKSV